MLVIQGQEWNFLNVYTPNSRTERTTFWESIRVQVAGEEWCIAGDFKTPTEINVMQLDCGIGCDGQTRTHHDRKGNL